MTNNEPTAEEFADAFDRLSENKEFLKQTMNTTARTTRGKREDDVPRNSN